ncbi:cation:proton antiporter, partial [Polaromonas sp.]|nr:cation:proton antiporter [Candidatus Saccharibacteria bacterium]
MDHTIFYQLSLVMAVAAGLLLVAKLLRQPAVIAYIVAGFVVGPSLLNSISDRAAFDSFSEIGIALLLFIIGLGLNVGIVKTTGKPALLSFLGIVAGVGALGYGAANLLGSTNTESLIIATCLLFSSTIVVIKAISDKKEQSRLYAKIAIGVLLAEDLAATIALIVVAAAGSGNAGGDLTSLILKGLWLGSILVLVGGYIMPKLGKLFASSQELLYVFAIAWAFGVASIFSKAGFSIEVGALFAGVTLASLPYVQAIESRLKPLRDFFIVLFFIKLGESLVISNVTQAILPTLVFTAIVLLAKPLIRMVSLGLLGYTKQTSFKTSLHLSQLSEFSIILIILAAQKNLVSQNTVTALTLTALITIAVSAYLMKYDDALYLRFKNGLSIFERTDTKREIKQMSHYPLVLLGYHNSGYTFVKTFREMKKRYVVIDYNPDVVESLENQHINHIYGDATDTELLDEINVRNAELIISTINNPSTNRFLARHITDANEEAIFICHATTLDDAGALYEAGASYVLLP